MAIDAEGTAINEFADATEGVRVSGQHLPSQWSGFAVPAVHPDTGQHADYEHLRQERKTRTAVVFSRLKLLNHHLNIRQVNTVTHPKCLSGTEETHILLLVLSEEGMC